MRLNPWNSSISSGRPRDHGVDDPLVADEEHAPFVGSEQQQRLFEAGIEPGQEEEIGAVLAVAVDGNPRRARPRQRLIAAPFVFGRIDRGRVRRPRPRRAAALDAG